MYGGGEGLVVTLEWSRIRGYIGVELGSGEYGRGTGSGVRVQLGQRCEE